VKLSRKKGAEKRREMLEKWKMTPNNITGKQEESGLWKQWKDQHRRRLGGGGPYRKQKTTFLKNRQKNKKVQKKSQNTPLSHLCRIKRAGGGKNPSPKRKTKFHLSGDTMKGWFRKNEGKGNGTRFISAYTEGKSIEQKVLSEGKGIDLLVTKEKEGD